MDVFGRALRYAARSRRRRRWAGRLIQAAVPVLPRKGPPREPIFIVASPRSGSTLLFDILSRSPHLASLEVESHLLWEMFHSDRGSSWRSHVVTPEQISEAERKALLWAIDRIARGRRYLDKSPRNSFRIPYLHALFPEARFVFLKRDGRANVSSLITAWRSESGMFPGLELPSPISIEGYRGTRWRFVAPPGWESYARGHALPEVCAFQWTASNQAILAAQAEVPADRWVDIRYEDLVTSPRAVANRALESLGLPLDEAVLSFAESLNRHVAKAVTPPRPDKWREENRQEVEAVLDQIAPTMRRLGYRIDD